MPVSPLAAVAVDVGRAVAAGRVSGRAVSRAAPRSAVAWRPGPGVTIGDERRRRAAGADPVGRDRPGRARLRPGRSRRRQAERREPGRVERVDVGAGRGRERLVVGHAVCVALDEVPERLVAVRADEEVDGRDRLAVGQVELGLDGREQAGQAVERDERLARTRRR